MENMEKNVYVDEVTGEVVSFDNADGRTFTGVYLTRKRVPSQKLKKMLWVYFVKGVIRGKEVKANFAPQSKDDIMTFTNLDIIFGEEDTAPIYIEKSSYKNKDGQLQIRTSYKVVCEDEFGEEFTATIIPQKDSDKSIFDYLCRRAKKIAEQEAAASQTSDVPVDANPETPAVKPENKK